MPEILTTRRLNRATLRRQLLLRREATTAAGAAEHAVRFDPA
jgi:hypothetical protein